MRAIFQVWLVGMIVSAVSEQDSVAQSPRTPKELQQIAWIIGDWKDRDENPSVRIHCEWVKNKHFLKSAFVVRTDGLQLEGIQLIGWDPEAGQIRSWIDSNGGFATGLWRRVGKQWISEPKFTHDDGARGSAMNLYTLIETKTFKWKCMNRTDSGATLPGIDEVTLYRRTMTDSEDRDSIK